jgi:hypothetical protein
MIVVEVMRIIYGDPDYQVLIACNMNLQSIGHTIPIPISPMGSSMLDWMETFAHRVTSGGYQPDRLRVQVQYKKILRREDSKNGDNTSVQYLCPTEETKRTKTQLLLAERKDKTLITPFCTYLP